MSNPIQSLNENFMYNSLLARALVPLMPAGERYYLRAWLYKLHEIDGDTDVLKIRNEYMWFLLLALQNRRITLPFTSDPPQGDIRELKEILPEDIYEDVLMTTEQNMSWVNRVSSGGELRAEPRVPCGPPSKFLQVQPQPKSGYTCYMAAFSDHS